MNMNDFEKVLTGLACCILRTPDDKPRCNDCPYEGNCVNRLKYDAFRLLNELEAHIVPLSKIQQLNFFDVVWLEIYWDGHTYLESLVLTSNEYQEPSLCNGISTYKLNHLHQNLIDSFSIDYNDVRYRFWSSKPSEFQRKQEKNWNTCKTKY